MPLWGVFQTPEAGAFLLLQVGDQLQYLTASL